MGKALAFGWWGIGVLTALAVIGLAFYLGPKDRQQIVDRCTTSAVQTYPTLGGREMVVGELTDCKGLTDSELAGVRKSLQDFGMEAVSRAGGA